MHADNAVVHVMTFLQEATGVIRGYVYIPDS